MQGSLDGHFDYECPSTGVESPVVSCPECMVPEGLAPTYRSGDPPNPGYIRELWTEDLGFWWCHERGSSTACPNGNPKPCGQGSCNRYDWNMSWGANLTLHGNYTWSALGEYRIGGAAGFDGAATTFGAVALTSEMHSALAARTVSPSASSYIQWALNPREVASPTYPTSSRSASPMQATPSCIGMCVRRTVAHIRRLAPRRSRRGRADTW